MTTNKTPEPAPETSQGKGWRMFSPWVYDTDADQMHIFPILIFGLACMGLGIFTGTPAATALGDAAWLWHYIAWTANLKAQGERELSRFELLFPLVLFALTIWNIWQAAQLWPTLSF